MTDTEIDEATGFQAKSLASGSTAAIDKFQDKPMIRHKEGQVAANTSVTTYTNICALRRWECLNEQMDEGMLKNDWTDVSMNKSMNTGLWGGVCAIRR